MKANELRIGNYVYDDYLKKNKQINGIFDNEIWLSEIGEDEFDQRSIIDSINPIPLTEEWLLKLGFENNAFDNFCYLHFNPRMGIRFLNFNSAQCEIIQDDKYIAFKWKHIEFVHQLQNLYFALTGKELTID